jgi:hypothetical protein
VGVRELARRAETDPGYVSRVLTLLAEEDVVARSKNGGVTDVNWKGLLTRWAQDYDVTRTNRTFEYLEPRSIDQLLRRLSAYKGKWALTGSRAVPRRAQTAITPAISCYIERPDQAALELGLRRVESGANVRLLRPFDSVIWERTRQEDGMTCVSMSQCAVDLLTGTGREPSEAQALLAWMAKNEDAWRA